MDGGGEEGRERVLGRKREREEGSRVCGRKRERQRKEGRM